MERVLEAGQDRVAAVGGHEVLGQVVRADAEEGNPPCQLGGQEGGGGDLHHDPGHHRPGARVAGGDDRGPGLVAEPVEQVDVLERRHHRGHDVGHDAGQAAGAPDRPQLGQQELAVAIGKPDRPDAEEGVGLGGEPEVRDLLVAPDVGEADDHRAPGPERLEGTSIGGDLLLLGRRRLALHEQELGPEEADALGARVERARRVVRAPDVRHEEDAGAVRRGAGSAARRRGTGTTFGERLRAIAQPGASRGVRVDQDEARFAVQGNLDRPPLAGRGVGRPRPRPPRPGRRTRRRTGCRDRGRG